MVASLKQESGFTRAGRQGLFWVTTICESKNKKGIMKLKLHRGAGFTLVEIMIVVAIIGLLAAIAIPNFVKNRNTAQASACIVNMKQIDSAIDQYAVENNKRDSDPITVAEIKEYIKGKELPLCPAGNVAYRLGTSVGATPRVTCENENSTPKHKISP